MSFLSRLMGLFQAEEKAALPVSDPFTLGSRVLANGQPNLSPQMQMLRDVPAWRWNVKVMGEDLAARHYGRVKETRKPERFDPFELKWRATQFSDFSQKWFLDACAKLRLAPVLHRKVWEDAVVLSSLEHAGMLTEGRRAIGFGCGVERFPSYFASKGVSVLATDLDPADRAAAGWIATNQHASLEKLFHFELVDRHVFRDRVEFSAMNMTQIPDDLDGQFDFVWSICAFEHLGSIAAGLDFVERSAKLLKPGGIAVHTTEFNYTSDEETIDNWGTVLFRQRDFTELAKRLSASGFHVPPLDFAVGSTPVDRFIDIPPFPGDRAHYYDSEIGTLHLKLMIDGFPSTCFALMVQRPA